MLIKFEVENFRSIKDAVELSMEVYRPDPHKLENVADIDNKGLLKVAAVYGANASGKSNLVRAIGLLRKLVLRSQFNSMEAGMDHQPFLFDDTSKDRPTTFFIDFFQEGIRYNYVLVYDGKRVISEEMSHYPKGRAALIFSRKMTDEGQQFRFNVERSKQNMISEITAENVLYLSKAATSNLGMIQPPFNWFKNKLIILTAGTPPRMDLIHRAIEESPKEFLSFVKMADLGIGDFEIEEKSMENRIPKEFESLWNQISELAEKRINTDRTISINAVHEIGDEVLGKYSLNINNESEGSRRLMSLIPRWIRLLKEGCVLFLDEMECQLHPLLVDSLISTLQNPDVNRKNAQLIFTSHDNQIIERNGFRRDQVWIAQRDPHEGVTTYDSLIDYKMQRVRNDEKMGKRYLEGRYGGVPMIRRWSIDI